jgi:hypothetical protein
MSQIAGNFPKGKFIQLVIGAIVAGAAGIGAAHIIPDKSSLGLLALLSAAHIVARQGS